MEIEKLNEQELASTKGGHWFYIGEDWVWIDTLSLDPEEDEDI